ncbi:MAG TPA: KH domain-containing protein [Vicinamibacteria bacterium]|nr:KH domain-containing protein [Vicinamibacteria bacterium]
MRELVALIARGLVREPDRVRVREHASAEGTVIELSVAPGDRGRVIGREGRAASALRTLVAALARRRGVACTLEILD